MAIVAASNVLVTLDEAKAYLEIALVDTAFDDKIQILVNACSSSIAKFCSRILVTKANVEFHDGRRNNILNLSEYPVNSVSEVVINSQSDFTDANDIVDTDYYNIDNSKTALVFLSALQNGHRNVRVTYSSGLGTASGDDLPWDLRFACLEYIKWLWKSEGDDRIGTSSKSKAGETTVYVQNIPQHIQQLLGSYVKLDFPNADVGIWNG